VGATVEFGQAAQRYSTFVLFGKPSSWAATVHLRDLNGADGFEIIGPSTSYNYFGERGMASGDINGDGYDDVIIPKPWRGDLGQASVYVVFGKANPWAASLNVTALDGTNGLRLDGTLAGGGTWWDTAGATIDSADMNDDGFDDLIIGVPYGQTAPNYGEVIVIYGKANGWAASALISSFVDGTQGFLLESDPVNSHAGYAQVGNLNGDDYPDLIVSAPDYYYTGYVHVVFGKATWPASTVLTSLMNGTDGFSLLHSVATGELFGHGIADINGDGYGEILVGAPLADGNLGYGYGVYGKASGWSGSYTLSTLCEP
jgi:hypothetical protein